MPQAEGQPNTEPGQPTTDLDTEDALLCLALIQASPLLLGQIHSVFKILVVSDGLQKTLYQRIWPATLFSFKICIIFNYVSTYGYVNMSVGARGD